MKAWKALGVVDTIYEEELFEDSISSSSSSFLSPSNSSPLHCRVQSWTLATGRNPDVSIHVQGTCFHLHKDPLTTKSIYLRRHLTSETELTLSPPLNITPETFALVADFCYDHHILLTPLNIAALRTAAETLDMTEPLGGDGDDENLWQITESYFRHVVNVNREYGFKVLRSCLALLPEAETTAFLVSRCVESLELTCENIDDLFEEVKTVRFDDFRAMTESMHRRLTRHDVLYWIVDFYFKNYEGETLSEDQKIQLCNSIDCNKLSPELLIHAVQNPKLPLRFLVRAMLVEHLNTRHSIVSSLSATSDHRPLATATQKQQHGRNKSEDSNDPITLGAILERDAALRQVAQLKAAVEATSCRIRSLEKELSGMREICHLRDSGQSIVDSARSASFHYGTSSEKHKIERGLSTGSASCRFSDRREVAGGGSSSSESSLSPRVEKNMRRRLINGLKSVFRVSKLSGSTQK